MCIIVKCIGTYIFSDSIIDVCNKIYFLLLV